MAYGWSILGVQITNDMKEFEKDYAKWQDKKRRYEAKRSSNSRKKAMDKAWNKAMETARRLNAKGRLTKSGAQRMGIDWTPDGGNAPAVVSPVTAVDPVTGLPVDPSTGLSPTPTAGGSPVVPLLIGGVAFVAVVGTILYVRRRR